jgi:hypothetical protein
LQEKHQRGALASFMASLQKVELLALMKLTLLRSARKPASYFPSGT